MRTLILTLAIIAILSPAFANELADAKAEIVALRAQNHALADQLKSTTETLQKTQDNLAQAMDEIHRLRPLAAKAVKMPVTLAKRKSITGSGEVLEVKNELRVALRVQVKLTAGTESKTFDLVIDAGKTKEIGRIQGWTLAPGDTVEISAAGYDTLKKRIDD
jgi:hypothetical protein